VVREEEEEAKEEEKDAMVCVEVGLARCQDDREWVGRKAADVEEKEEGLLAVAPIAVGRSMKVGRSQ
jgi:hypothetical protein